MYSDPSVCLAGAHYYAGHDPESLSHAVINQSRPDVSTYSTLPLLNQKISSLYFPLSLSDCCLPSHLDTEVTVHNIEAGQQRGDEVGLVAPHEGGGLVELLQHVALAHQQTEVVRQLFLKRYSLFSECFCVAGVWSESETQYGSVKGDYSHPAGERFIRDTSLVIIPPPYQIFIPRVYHPDLHEGEPEPGPGPAHTGPHCRQVPHTRRDVRGLRIQLLNLLEQVPQLLLRAQQALGKSMYIPN